MPTCKEMMELDKRIKENWKKMMAECEESCKDKPSKYPEMKIDKSKFPKERHDSPYTMEDSTATFLWIVVMIVSPIFVGGWVIWIIATAIWRKFVKRYK